MCCFTFTWEERLVTDCSPCVDQRYAICVEGLYSFSGFLASLRRPRCRHSFQHLVLQDSKTLLPIIMSSLHVPPQSMLSHALFVSQLLAMTC